MMRQGILSAPKFNNVTSGAALAKQHGIYDTQTGNRSRLWLFYQTLSTGQISYEAAQLF